MSARGKGRTVEDNVNEITEGLLYVHGTKKRKFVITKLQITSDFRLKKKLVFLLLSILEL